VAPSQESNNMYRDTPAIHQLCTRTAKTPAYRQTGVPCFAHYGLSSSVTKKRYSACRPSIAQQRILNFIAGPYKQAVFDPNLIIWDLNSSLTASNIIICKNT